MKVRNLPEIPPPRPQRKPLPRESAPRLPTFLLLGKGWGMQLRPLESWEGAWTGAGWGERTRVPTAVRDRRLGLGEGIWQALGGWGAHREK